MSIEQKIKQMYKALADMAITDKLPSIEPKIERDGKGFRSTVDFTAGTDSITAANRISQVLANIACLKDHLKTTPRLLALFLALFSRPKESFASRHQTS
jgi:hypothetical protein